MNDARTLALGQARDLCGCVLCSCADTVSSAGCPLAAALFADIRHQQRREAERAAVIARIDEVLAAAPAPHEHETAYLFTAPGTGIVTHQCECGAFRVLDHREMEGERGEPKATEWVAQVRAMRRGSGKP